MCVCVCACVHMCIRVCVCVLINWYMCIVSGGRPSVKEPLLFCYVLFNDRHSKKTLAVSVGGSDYKWA